MNMTYSFLQDTEPSEAQLEMIMREVAEEARVRHEKEDADFIGITIGEAVFVHLEKYKYVQK